MAKKFKIDDNFFFPNYSRNNFPLTDKIKRFENCVFQHRQQFVKEIITEVIKKEARKEAVDIMSKCDSKYIDQLLYNYNKKSFNIVCMVIDVAKWKLIEDKKMKSKKNDHFGVVGGFEVRSKKIIKKAGWVISKHNGKWKIQK